MVGALSGMGALHFAPRSARTMAAIVPPRLRDRPLSAERLVQLTGVCELAGAAGLVLPRTRPAAAVALIAFYVAVFPANAYAARHPERFGPVAVPFWPRLAGQVGIAALTAFAATGGRVSR
ncbi:hypothetical protein D1781_15010 [Amnibacterium setariae]|uniref:DoxX family membrane protein n=2 Tax=Amnibacterium setariae TaxID=2306585 RepID=A0A3A1TZG7_9MICO|nr:hypothetical protein D1781_15010 [Amnibacterium setariae]